MSALPDGSPVKQARSVNTMPALIGSFIALLKDGSSLRSKPNPFPNPYDCSESRTGAGTSPPPSMLPRSRGRKEVGDSGAEYSLLITQH